MVVCSWVYNKPGVGCRKGKLLLNCVSLVLLNLVNGHELARGAARLLRLGTRPQGKAFDVIENRGIISTPVALVWTGYNKRAYPAIMGTILKNFRTYDDWRKLEVLQ